MPAGSPDCLSPDATAAYRRAARRLRARLAHRPAELHAKLAELARPAAPVSRTTLNDAAPSWHGFSTRVFVRPRPSQAHVPAVDRVTVGRIGPTVGPIAEATLMRGQSIDGQHAIRTFIALASAELARRATAGGRYTLTHDEQAGLLAEAGRLGIGRFHANLTLAVLCHESAGVAKNHSDIPFAGRSFHEMLERPARGRWRLGPVTLAIGLIAEAAVATAWVWWHLAHF